MEKKYPQWLFTVLQNDYGEDDNYWYDINTDDAEFKEAYIKLRALKRKYSDINKWRAACTLYDDYIGVIIEHNGGEYAVASMFKSDIVPEGWVPRPKLKTKKTNKTFLSTGVTPSKVDYSFEDIAVINEIANEEAPLTDAISSSIPDVAVKPKGEVKAAIDKALEISEERDRISRMHKSRENFDVLSLYYRETAQEAEDGNLSIRAMFDAAVNEMFDKEHDDGWEYTSDDHAHTQKYTFMRNQLYSRADKAQIDIAREILENNGLVTFDMNSMSKDKVRLYRSEFGIEFDPKRRKKAEKELKKYEKDRKRREESALDLARVLTRNQNGEIDLSEEKFTLNDYRKKYRKD